MKMFAITQDGYFLASDRFTPDEFINTTLQAQMQLFQSILSQATEDEQPKLKGELYDMYNLAASAFLEAFDPDSELRPDLTAEAILKAENEILDSLPTTATAEAETEAINVIPFRPKED